MSERSGRITLLLVDDHRIFRLGIKSLLQDSQEVAVIAEAENGQEAIKLAFAREPDIVLMDVGMPVMDGIEATRQIMEKKPEFKIIMCSAHDSEDDVFAALTAGAHGYCLKNVESTRLLAGIRSVYAGELWLDSDIANTFMKYIHAREPQQTNLSAERDFPFEPLSTREMEVLSLLVEGLSNKSIGERLFVSPETVKTHVRHIMEKLAVSDRTQAAVMAVRRGLV